MHKLLRRYSRSDSVLITLRRGAAKSYPKVIKFSTLESRNWHGPFPNSSFSTLRMGFMKSSLMVVINRFKVLLSLPRRIIAVIMSAVVIGTLENPSTLSLNGKC